ncbi:hypothetical protein [Bacillus sp. 2205SS5-2]|uniref:hypothetical protein n=1 Tax=Bacillus sp. 2205SS5-2 TaxID=3109031 RepID=UPI00300644E9
MNKIYKESFAIIRLVLLIKFVFFTSIACAIAWVLGAILQISINYFIPIGLMVILYIFVGLLTFVQLKTMKNISDHVGKGFKL